MGDLEPDAPIASVSFGATRRFEFKPKRPPGQEAAPEEVRGLQLTDGSLLVMAGDTQRNWLHAVPADRANTSGLRINFTFRVVRSRLNQGQNQGENEGCP